MEKGLPGRVGSQYDLSITIISIHIVTAAVRGDVRTQYDLSVTTLSIHIVTAALRGHKPADGIGSGNSASQVTGPVGKKDTFLFSTTDVAYVDSILLDVMKSKPADHQGVGGDDAIR